MNSPSKFTAIRLLKCLISLGVYAFTICLTWIGRLLGRVPRGTCVILYYHSIPPQERAHFAEQLDTILRVAEPIDVTRDVHLRPGVRCTGITFDDAFENFVDQALPELEKRNLPVTIFVISDALGKPFGPTGCAERVMSLEQLRSLPTELVSIGSHTVTHPMLPLVSEKDARSELVQSRKSLEGRLRRAVLTFSFPFGGFSERLIELCREAGYERVFTTLPGFAFRDPKEFVLGRVRVDPTDWPIEFRLKVAGAYRWLPAAFVLKRKIISWPLLRRLLRRLGPPNNSTGPGNASEPSFGGSGF